MPVGGSVDEGVAILRYGEALRPSARCLYEAVEHLGVGLPSRCFLAARALSSRELAYKTTRKYHDKVARTIAVESPLICAS